MSWIAIIIVAIVFLSFGRAQSNSAEEIRELISRVDDLEDKTQHLEAPNDADDYEYY